MQIDIDIDFLIENNITANQYLILYLLTSKKYAYLKKYLEISKFSYDDIQNLKDNSFIHYTSDNLNEIEFDQILIRSKFKELLNEKDFFDDFFDIFPIKTIRPDGKIDFLRTSSEKARKKYAEITKNKKSNHERILRCLQYELKVRELEGNMAYIKKMINWLDNEEWLPWEERMKEQPFIIDVTTNNLGYGHELV